MSKNIAISWESVNHAKDKVYDKFIELLKHKDINIQKQYMLYDDKVHEDKDNKELRQIKLESPTNHKDIYTKLKVELKKIIEKEGNSCRYFINISPGTPAMHSVWLILYAEGLLPNTTLYQTQKIKEKNEVELFKIDFEKNTYLESIKKIRSKSNKKFYSPDEKYASDKLNKLILDIQKSCNINIPILILGERGTGKTSLIENTFAAFKGKDIVHVNCGSLSETVQDSELFGHMQGAFTGADKARKGYIKEAENKILFLDEVQDLSKSTQRKLVDFLENRRYRQLGSDNMEKSNAALVFASHKSYKELSQILDDDLFDRISYLVFEVPALRELDKSDIKKFLIDMWDELEKSNEIPEKINFTDTQISKIIASGLNGNFRSLKSLLIRIVIDYDNELDFGKIIDKAINDWLIYERVESDTFVISPLLNMSGNDAVKLVRYELANYYYQKNNQNAVKAAKELHVNNTTLKNWLSKNNT